MVQGLEKTLAKALKLGFYAADIWIRSTFFCFLGMALVDTIPQGTLDIIQVPSFGHLSQLDATKNKLLNKLHMHTALAQDLAEVMARTIENKIEDEAEKEDDDVIDPLWLETKWSSKAMDDNLMAQGVPRHRG